MRILALVIKVQGENREPGEDGKLHSTQDAWLKPVIALDGHITWWGPRKKSIEKCRAATEDLLGPLEWRGFPALYEITKDLRGSPQVKAAAIVALPCKLPHIPK